MRLALLSFAALLAACGGSSLPPPRDCDPRLPPLEISGEVASGDVKTYRMLPFEVSPNTGRVELSYRWTEKDGPPVNPFTRTTLDLGLWDQGGYRNQAAFRGWGGSRQGRIDEGDEPIFVQADKADRGFNPGPVLPGRWHAELGIAAVSPQGADYVVKIECKVAHGEPPAADPADPAHVANAAAGWYHGDFHMHAYHSHAQGPEANDFVALARAAGLDFLMYTEYVTGAHWDTVGAAQRANPDILIWPGREIITYFGHVNTHGETPGLFEYRHGFEDVDIGWVQAQAKAAGALFQVNHPTIFPPPAFTNFCRGCYFELGESIDWGQVDTIEVLTGGVLVNSSEVGVGGIPGEIETPFMQAAIDLWDEQLMAGHKITAVSGSDSKGAESTEEDRQRKGYGSSATAVYASNLSRAALTAALQAGRAYVRAKGAGRSPSLEFTATAPDSSEVMFGGTLLVAPTDDVTLHVVVRGGLGQTLTYFQNGEQSEEVTITGDPFVHDKVVRRAASEGPLGTFWGIETRDAQARTTIANPIFLKGP